MIVRILARASYPFEKFPPELAETLAHAIERHLAAHGMVGIAVDVATLPAAEPAPEEH
jgi:hypothetical protein